MKQEHMDAQQYNELTKTLNKMSADINALSKGFTEMDTKVTSISTWIHGDPSFKSSVGTDEKIQRLEVKVNKNERELESIKRLDTLEDKVAEHDDKLDKIFTAVMVVGVIFSIVGFLIGVFLPPFLG